MIRVPTGIVLVPEMTDGAKLTWICLIGLADRTGTGAVSVSTSTIARARGITKQCAAKHVRRLEDAGWIVRTRSPGCTSVIIPVLGAVSDW
jgi:DNA-binding IscR family transcriptional regulator